MKTVTGFAPVADAACRTLILGTAPSELSLGEGFYYAHPRNAFWRVLADAHARPLPRTREEKIDLALSCRVALWDVLRACEREGSLDAAIRAPQPNDFSAFFARYAGIGRVLFNGATAQALFFRLCPGALGDRTSARLPSTSPACTMPYAQKLALWRKELLL